MRDVEWVWRRKDDPADVGEFFDDVPPGFFKDDSPVTLARAPGRLDVMGGFADYSGSLVLQWPLERGTIVAVQRTSSPRVRVMSLATEATFGTRELELDVATLVELARDPDVRGRAHFGTDSERAWGAYVIGALVMLGAEGRLDPAASGWRILVRSTVPEAKGVASSAALEVATLHAVCVEAGVRIGHFELVTLARRVENVVVGAACGIMDQVTAFYGRADHLLRLLCRPATIEAHVPLPSGLTVWGIDSGVRHAVGGSDYAGVRVGAFMGRRMLAESLSRTSWDGPLASLTPDAVAPWVGSLPEVLSGADFLDRYGETGDDATVVDPDRTYAVRAPTLHPIHENARVHRFAHLLATGGDPDELGELMGASHRSYSACGLGSEATDLLVELVAAERAAGLYGAKITGGGSGGTVAVFGEDAREAHFALERVAQDYRARTRRSARVLHGSSSGALDFGTRHFRIPLPPA